MSDKIGRNSSCPCGSGKKFKKCCGVNGSSGMDDLLAPMPDNLLTGTKVDFYFDIYRSVLLYSEGLKSDPELGTELRRFCGDFEERFKPGTEYGLPDSFYLNWFLFDNRFGIDQRTVIESLMEEDIFKEPTDEVRQAFCELSESYATCNQIKKINENSILFEELVTGLGWRVNRIGDTVEGEAKPGDIWHARFVGPREDAYYFGQPFVFGKEAKRDFIKIIKGLISTFEEYASTRSLEFKKPRDAFKAAIGFWADYFYKGTLMHLSDNFLSDEIPPNAESKPILCTTDGEKVRFSEVIFKIIEKDKVRDKLSALKGIEYDDENDCWIWSKKGNRRMKSRENTILGWIHIKGERIVCVVNSLERALKLKNKLTMRLGKAVCFERIDSKDHAAMPEPSQDEMRKFSEEQRRINTDPEIRKALIQKQKEYYLKDWISSKIPALDGKTPRQAVKTKEGRLQLEVLINRMEGMEMSKADYLPKMDMNFLREALGLPFGDRVQSNIDEDDWLVDTIDPKLFYTCEKEKIKLNWFCYEFALSIYDEVKECLGKDMEKYDIDDNMVAEFSVYTSKNSKEQILCKLSGQIDKIYFDYEPVKRYFSSINDKLVNKFQDAIFRAWDELLKECEKCSVRCISEKDEYCTMFDDEGREDL